MIGTLWGAEHLISVYDCLKLNIDRDLPGKEGEYYKFIDLHDRKRRLMRSEYFRTVSKNPSPHDHRKPWTIDFSAGREFDPSGRPDDSNPIVFVRFGENPSREHVARQPIVTGALLEIRAVHMEMSAGLSIISKMEDPTRTVEMHRFNDQYRRMMYTPSLTLYTAPAHMLAHHAKISDVMAAYAAGAAISSAVLNMNSDHFQNLIPSNNLNPWRNLFDGFRKRKDHGFAYKVICSNLDRWSEGLNLEEWIDTALQRSGLPKRHEILVSAKSHIEPELRRDIETPLDLSLSHLLETGVKVIEEALNERVSLDVIPSFHTINPPIYDPDGELVFLSNEFDFSKFDPEIAHEAGAKLHTWLLNFLPACR